MKSILSKLTLLLASSTLISCAGFVPPNLAHALNPFRSSSGGSFYESPRRNPLFDLQQRINGINQGIGSSRVQTQDRGFANWGGAPLKYTNALVDAPQ
jgi:hypothetical protein